MSPEPSHLAAPSFERRFGERVDAPAATVVVVVWQLTAGLERCLRGLASIGTTNWELIVVGSGVDPTPIVEAFQTLNGTVLGLAENRGPSPARNLAGFRAAGPILAFLDDDAIPEPDWLDSHLELYGHDQIVAGRGRVVANEHPWLTRLARSYDLGNVRRPAVLNTEGNASIRTAAFRDVGGFSDMFGHEGVELTGRLAERFGPDSIVYDPAPIIRHDYVSGVGYYMVKRFRHGRMLSRLGMGEIRTAAAVRGPRRRRDILVAPLRVLGGLAEVAGWASAVATRRSQQ